MPNAALRWKPRPADRRRHPRETLAAMSRRGDKSKSKSAGRRQGRRRTRMPRRDGRRGQSRARRHSRNPTHRRNAGGRGHRLAARRRKPEANKTRPNERIAGETPSRPIRRAPAEDSAARDASRQTGQADHGPPAQPVSAKELAAKEHIRVGLHLGRRRQFRPADQGQNHRHRRHDDRSPQARQGRSECKALEIVIGENVASGERRHDQSFHAQAHSGATESSSGKPK